MTMMIMVIITSYSTATVSEFGFKKYNSLDNSGQDAPVTLTLYWNKTISQCIIPKDEDGLYGGGILEWSCDTNSITEIGANNQEEYKMKFMYINSGMFRPEKIHVIESSNRYTIDEFCGPLQYYYWDNSNPNPDLCANSFNRYNYRYLELDTNTAYLSTLYVTFADDLFAHPNSALPGMVSPAKVKSFSIKTANVNNSANNHQNVTLRLYWDIDLYVCSIVLSEPHTTYTCYVSDPSQTDAYSVANRTNPSSFALFIESCDTDIAYIDSVFVHDESNYNYSVDTFCLDNVYISIGGTAIGTSCTSVGGSLSKFEDISIKNYPVSIEFGKDMFYEPNYNHEAVVSSTTSLTTMNCVEVTTNPTSSNPTSAEPTSSWPTTFLPTTMLPTTAIPTTAIPTTAEPTSLMPSTAIPTELPTFIMPTIYPTKNKQQAVEGQTTEIEINTVSDSVQSNNSDDKLLIAAAVFSITFVLVIIGIVFYFAYTKGIKKGIQRAMTEQEQKGEESGTAPLPQEDGDVMDVGKVEPGLLHTTTSMISKKSDSLEKMYINKPTTGGQSVISEDEPCVRMEDSDDDSESHDTITPQ